MTGRNTAQGMGRLIERSSLGTRDARSARSRVAVSTGQALARAAMRAEGAGTLNQKPDSGPRSGSRSKSD